MAPYIGYDSDTTFIPGTLNTSSSLTIQGGGITQTGGDVNFDSGTLFLDEDLNRVGIGTTNPLAKLHIQGTTSEIWLRDSGTKTLALQTSNDIQYIKAIDVGVGGLPLEFYASRYNFGTGNVGIGTTNPGHKLHVNGTIINSTNVNSTGDSGIQIANNHRLGFDQEGTRSWTIKAVDGVLRFSSGDAAGVFEFQHINPDGDASRNLGSPTMRWANIYSADLQLSNEGSANDVDGTWGAYTIQEGEENLYLINRRSGKKFKFVLEEVK